MKRNIDQLYAEIERLEFNVLMDLGEESDVANFADDAAREYQATLWTLKLIEKRLQTLRKKRDALQSIVARARYLKNTMGA